MLSITKRSIKVDTYKQSKSIKSSKKITTTPKVIFGVDKYEKSEVKKFLEKGNGFANSNILEDTDWEIFAENAIEKHRGKLKELFRSDGNLSAYDKIVILDNLSEEIGVIVDRAVVSISLSSDQEKAHFAQRAYGLIAEFFNEILSDRDLFKVIADLLKNKDQLENEQIAFLKSVAYSYFLVKEARDDYDKYTAVDLLKKLNKAHSQYIITKGDHDLDQTEISDFSLREYVFNMKAHKYTVSRDRKTYFNFSDESLNFVFKNSHSENLKKFIFNEKYKNVNDIQSRFQDIIQARKDLVKYAGIELKDLAHTFHYLSRDEQVKFLEEIHDATLPQANTEKERIIESKRSTATYPVPSKFDIHPWDQIYYAHQYSVPLLSKDKIEHYLELENVLQGIYSLFEDVFSVSIKPAKHSDSEIWHPSVTKLVVKDNETGNSGIIYLDLFERHFKEDSQCVFPVQNISAEEKEAAAVISMNLDPNTKHLSFDELRNLFIEFGDALHVISSKSKLYYVSGSRCYYDFQETSGLVFGYFASDWRVLNRFAKHFQTGEVIPEETVVNAIEAKRALNATKIQWQVYIAMLDYHLNDANVNPNKTTHLSANLMEKYTNVTYPINTSWHFHQDRLMIDNALQYASLYQSFNSWKIWKSCFEENPFDKSKATRYREEALSKTMIEPPVLMEKLTGKTTKEQLSDFVNSAVLPDRFHSFN